MYSVLHFISGVQLLGIQCSILYPFYYMRRYVDATCGHCREGVAESMLGLGWAACGKPFSDIVRMARSAKLGMFCELNFVGMTSYAAPLTITLAIIVLLVSFASICFLLEFNAARTLCCTGQFAFVQLTCQRKLISQSRASRFTCEDLRVF